MRQALETAKAVGDARQIEYVRDSANKLRCKFTEKEIVEIRQLISLGTLKPDEIFYRCANEYQFSRRLQLSPRKNLVSDMIDIFDQYHLEREVIEEITGKYFSTDLDIFVSNLRDVSLALEDVPLSWGLIAGLAATIVLSPIAAWMLFDRLKKNRHGVVLVLRGRMSVMQGVAPPYVAATLG
jgi:hypothetical protein